MSKSKYLLTDEVELCVNVNTKMYNFSNLLMHKIVHF